MPKALAVRDVEKRFIAEAKVVSAFVVQFKAYILEAEDDDSDLDQAAEDEQVLAASATDDGKTPRFAALSTFDEAGLTCYYRRRLNRGLEEIDFTVNVTFSYNPDLQLHLEKYSSLRSRLAGGFCEQAARPYLTGIARQIVGILGPVPIVPEPPSDRQHMVFDITQVAVRSDEDAEAGSGAE